MPCLLSPVATWAVWRAASVVLKSERAALEAALLFSLMPMIGIETLVATPDAPAITASACLLLFMARIAEEGRGPLWLAAGVAAGCALVSKYTGFFLGVGILFWLAVVPKERRWFHSLWPYLGAALAVAMFAPVVVWNAQHGWISFAAQFGRIGAGGFALRYLLEFLGAQLGLASPFIAVLAVAGIAILWGSRKGKGSASALPFAMTFPAGVYFLWHSLFDRVQGNWPSFLYPAFAIAAAAACERVRDGEIQRLGLSRQLAVPVAALLTGAIYVQAVFGVVPRIREPISRLLAVGIERVADDIETLRTQVGAKAIITTAYAPAAWLSFYLPSHPPVVQVNERFRWVNEPPPERVLFEGPVLYVTEIRNDQAASLKMRFAIVEPLAHVGRYRNGAELDEYMVYRVEGLRGEPFF